MKDEKKEGRKEKGNLLKFQGKMSSCLSIPFPRRYEKTYKIYEY